MPAVIPVPRPLACTFARARSFATSASFLAGCVAAVLACTGCASIPVPREPTPLNALQHIIRVNEKGVLLTLEKKPAPADYQQKHLVEPLRAALQRPGGPRRVLIFVHGGLNDYDAAYDHFRRRFCDLEQAGYYPLFVMWPSGLTGTYFEHLTRIRQGRHERSGLGRAFAAVTLPLVLAQDLGTGLVRTPMTTLQTLRSDLQTTIPPNSGLGERDAVAIYRKLVRDEFPVSIGNDYKTEAEMAERVASYWLTLPTKLATAGPVIDALGRPAWDDMLRRTYMVFPGTLADNEQRASNAAVQGTSRIERKQEVRSSSFASIVTELERLQAETHFELTLVGHSMGAIVLNHLLDATKLEAKRIIYLAAACSIRDYAQSVLPYLEAHPGASSYNLTLHPMAEDGEWQKQFLDLPPRGSLLVWIDNFLSNPVYEQDRTFGRWTNLFMTSPTGNSAIEDILLHRGTEGRIHFRAFGVGGGETPRRTGYQWNDFPAASPPPKPTGFTPDRHGAMASIEFWRDEVLKP